MKRLFKRQFCPASLILVAALAACATGGRAAAASRIRRHGRIPPGWQAAAPSEEIRPNFSFDPKGGPRVTAA